MPLFIECPSGHRLKVPSKHAGLRIVCPVCNQSLAVPPLSPPPKFGATSPTPIPSPQRTKLENVAPVDLKTELTAEPSPHQNTPATEPKPVVDVPPTRGSSAKPDERIVDAAEQPVSQPAALNDVSPKAADSPKVDSLGHSGSESLPDPISTFAIDGPASVDAPKAESALAPCYDPLDVVLRIDEHLADSHHAEINADRDRRLAVFVLGFASILVAMVCAIPSFIDQYGARLIGINTPDVWSYLVLLISVIQIGIAVYAMRLPDWSTVWVAGIIATAGAAAYALGLALTMFASQEHQLVQSLGLLDEAFRWQAQPWCFFAMCLTLIVAFLYGRFSLRWYQQERQLAASRL